MEGTTGEKLKEEVMAEMKHLVAIFTEDIDSKFKLVLEVVQATGESLERQMKNLQDELKADIQSTQQAMRFMYESLRIELKADIKDVAAQCRENRLAIGRLEQRFDDLDRRMTITERNVSLLQTAAG